MFIKVCNFFLFYSGSNTFKTTFADKVMGLLRDKVYRDPKNYSNKHTVVIGAITYNNTNKCENRFMKTCSFK